ncbi:MAG: ribonuclease III [Fuerstiella sp.]|nr:ribonuclease III [Fuerstiella sp.]
MSNNNNAAEVVSSDREQILLTCEDRIGYSFRDKSLLLRGLTHSSCAVTRLDCNERMEFLGDAVLGMVICEYLYQHFPDRREGQLTQQKSHIVSRAVCAQVAARLELEHLIFVGKGLQAIPESLKAAVVESLIAAIYLDGGYEAAGNFILRAFGTELENCSEGDAENYKSLLQEEIQRDGSLVPQYVIVDERGPDHAREFHMAVQIGDQRYGGAWGRSKKEAEQKAAMNALDTMHAG